MACGPHLGYEGNICRPWGDKTVIQQYKLLALKYYHYHHSEIIVSAFLLPMLLTLLKGCPLQSLNKVSIFTHTILVLNSN